MDNKENVSFNIVKQNEPTATAKSFKTNSPVKKNRQTDSQNEKSIFNRGLMML